MSIPAFVYNLFTAQWFGSTPEQTATFPGQTIIVTGANTGLGLETVKYMLTHKAARIILACRSTFKGEVAKRSLEEQTGIRGVIEVWQLDLASYDSIKAFASRADSTLERLDVVISNAGISTNNPHNVNGFENHIGTNVISTFLLSLLVLPKLKQTGEKYKNEPRPPKLVIISSDTHRADIFPEAKKYPSDVKLLAPETGILNDPKTARQGSAYFLSKLLDVLLTRQLAAHVSSLGSRGGKPSYPVIINTANPGLCYSDLTREVSRAAMIPKLIFGARTAEVGVRNFIWAANAGPETHGAYVSECGLNGLSGYVTSSDGEEAAKRVWVELQEILEGIQPGLLARL